jgi:S1-C subfamily serine protease
MRNLIIVGVVGLALGLAAQMLPRALGGDATAGRVSDARALSMPGVTTATQTSKMRAAGVSPASRGGAAEASREAAARVQAVLAESNRPDEPAGSVAPGAEPERDRVMRLISAGFTHDRALEIVQKESQLRRAAIDREYAATGTIRPLNFSSTSAVEQQLRSEMGDSEYEKYLEATGQTTRIRVGDIDTGSAAANAGVLPGDEIVEYAGRRVFNLRELNALMLQTPEGETVAATIVRDGQAMKLYVTGGALGFSQAGFR